jgi:2,4-dienoyl-CoA reductase-like NADH-dependent reductase (Old Yellow Enzyme family)
MADLFCSLSFRCGISAPNRVALAPLTNTQSHDDGALGDDELRWLVRRARGGWGLISTCAAHVSPEAKGFVGQLGLFSDAHDAGLRQLASALVAEKTVPIVQLYHGGARSPFALTGARPVSAVAGEGEGDDVARAMTEREILACVDHFASAAERAQRAGFVGAEVHGAHGYLLCQFLSRNNTRADGWGGSLEGRARIVREVIRAVRSRCGAGFLLGVRLSPEDFGYAAGMDLDESVALARWFAEDGADFVHLSLWDYNKPSIKRPSEDIIALFRAALDPAVRLLVAGRIGTVADANAVLARGADMVSIGRAAILEPDWPTRARDANWSPEAGPLSRDELIERDVSARFVEYLRRFKTIVRAE